MTETHFNQYAHLTKTEKYPIKSHFIFGATVILFVLFISLFFKNIIMQTLQYFPFFGYSTIILLAIGIIYYFYKIIIYKNLNQDSNDIRIYVNQQMRKVTREFNILQIFIAVIGTISLIAGVLNILDSTHDNTILNNQKMLVQPFYIILISLTAISFLFIISLRLKEMLSQFCDMYRQGLSHKKTIKTHQPLSTVHNGVSMSKIISDESVQQDTMTRDDNDVPFTLPNYDNGFFYKKLFEINDNVLHLKRQIIVAGNDNITETQINSLWDNKIYPFLSNISDRIKELEGKFDSYNRGLDNHVNDKKITDRPLETLPFDVTKPQDDFTSDGDYANIEKTKAYNDFVKEITHKIVTQTQNGLIGQVTPVAAKHDFIPTEIPEKEAEKESEEVFNLMPADRIDADTKTESSEETFATSTHVNIADNFDDNGHKNHTIKNTKEKTLKEMRDFLQSKMQQFHNNEFSKST